MSFKILGRIINQVVSRGMLPARDRRHMIDAVLVIDTSPSMEESDYAPSRIAAAQMSAVRYVGERSASGVEARIGIVHFGEVAAVACPLTSTDDTACIKAKIDQLSIIGGTSITAGLLAAESLFKQSPKEGVGREIRLLTDGTHNVGPGPHQVAERLKQQGCTIHALGIGGNRGAVDEALLKEICSKDENGEPLYEFIADQQGLMRYFGEAGGLTR